MNQASLKLTSDQAWLAIKNYLGSKGFGPVFIKEEIVQSHGGASAFKMTLRLSNDDEKEEAYLVRDDPDDANGYILLKAMDRWDREGMQVDKGSTSHL